MSESDTMFNEWYQRCAAVQLRLSTIPSYDNRTMPAPSKCKSRWFNAWGHSSRHRTTLSGYGYGLWWGFKWEQRHATSYLQSWLESQHQSIPGCAEYCGDPLVQSGVRWLTLDVAAILNAGPQVLRDPGLASEGVLRLCTLLSLAPLLPRPEAAGLPRLVIRLDHHQHDLPQHQSQPDRRHLPSIRWAPAGACGKGLLPVLDPYQGGDWGWRLLQWLDVSSITLPSYLNWFFQ